MRTKSLVVLAVLTFVSGAPARADGPKVDISSVSAVAVWPMAAGSPANGLTCSFSAVSDPLLGQDVQSGLVSGGPVNTPGQVVSIGCAIQAGGGNATHSGMDIRSATSMATLGATTLPPSPQSFQWPLGQPLWLCTQVTVDGMTSYWDAESSHWSASSEVPCALALSQEFVPGPDSVFQPVVDAFDAAALLADPYVCPLLLGPLLPLGPAWVYLWHCQ